MRYCPECGYVNSHSPNCPEADDWVETEEEEADEGYHLED